MRLVRRVNQPLVSHFREEEPGAKMVPEHHSPPLLDWSWEDERAAPQTGKHAPEDPRFTPALPPQPAPCRLLPTTSTPAWLWEPSLGPCTFH